MKKAVYGVLGLAAVLVAAALVLPFVVDLNDYKNEIAARVKAATGRDLVIAGNIDFALLPVPTVAVNDARLANLTGAASPVMVRVEAIEARLALSALLSGEVEFESLRLLNPVVELEVLADGRANWVFAAAGGAPAPSDGSEKGGGFDVRLESLVVENGTIVYRDSAKGLVERIERLNMVAGADSLAGPYRAEGRLVALGAPMNFKLALGSIRSAPVTVKAEFDLTSAEASLSFNGFLRSPSTDAELAGKLKLQGSSLARVVAAFGGAAGEPLGSTLGRRFSLTGLVSGSARAVGINDIVFELDGVQGTGAVSAAFDDVSQVDVALAFNRIDLDQLLAGASPGEILSAALSIGSFELPAKVNATVDLRVSAVVLNRSVARQVQVVAALDEGVLTLQQASALLPGGSDMTVFGVLDQVDGKSRFTGQVEASTDNLRAVLDWLRVPIPQVPADRLRKVSISTKLEITPRLAKLTALDLRVDLSRLSGAVNVAIAPRPAFNAIFAIDRLNVDAYLPKVGAASATAGETPAEAGATPFAVLTAFDGEVKARVGSLVYRTVPISGFTIDAGVRSGTLTLRSLSVEDMAGARGTVSGLVEAAGPAVDLTYNLSFDDPGRFARAFGMALPAPLQSLGGLDARGRVEGNLSAVTVSTTLAITEAEAKFAGKVTGLGAKPAVDGTVEVRGKNLKRFARRFGADLSLAPPGADGPFSLEGRVKGDGERAEVSLSLSAAGVDAALDGIVTGVTGTPAFDVVVTATHPDLAALAGAEGVDLSGRELGGVRVRAHVVGGTEETRFSDIDASIGPVRLGGVVVARWDGPRPRLDADLTASEIVVGVFLPAMRGMRGMRGQAGAGDGGMGSPPAAKRWSRAPIDLSSLRAVDLDARIAADALSFGKYRIDAVLLHLKLADGVLEVDELVGRTYGAPIRIAGSLDGGEVPAGEMTFSVDGADLRALLADVAGVNVVSGRLDLSGRFRTHGRSEFELVSALAGEAAISVRDGVIQGLDLARFNQRLGSLESEADFLRLVGATLTGGATRIETFEGTVTATAGVLRIDDLRVVLEGGEGSVEGTVDLPRWQLALDSEFRLTGHAGAPPVGIVLRGPIDNPSREIRDQDLRAYVSRNVLGGKPKKVAPKSGGPPPTEPPDESAMPRGQSVSLPEEIALPSEQAAPKPEESAMPREQSVSPPEEIALPSEQAAPKPEESEMPREQSALPPEESVPPPEESAPPPGESAPKPAPTFDSLLKGILGGTGN